jgi:RNA polymerase sigma-70 factor (ECF subfamily)
LFISLVSLLLPITIIGLLYKIKLGTIDKVWAEVKMGSEKAFYVLYTSLFHPLIRYVVQIVKDAFIAEEIVQETFIKLWENRESIMIIGSVKVYIFKIAHNLSINKLENLATAKNAVNRTVRAEEWLFVQDTYRVDDTIIEQIEAEEMEKRIRQAINSLPAKCRDVFCLSRCDCLDNETIAKKMNISINTVRAHIYNALEFIKKELESE